MAHEYNIKKYPFLFFYARFYIKKGPFTDSSCKEAQYKKKDAFYLMEKSTLPIWAWEGVKLSLVSDQTIDKDIIIATKPKPKRQNKNVTLFVLHFTTILETLFGFRDLQA